MFWEENLRVLKEVHPRLAERVEGVTGDAPCEVVPSAGGWPTARWRDGGHVHSAVDPWREARRLVDGAGLEDPDVVVVLGLGLGYHVMEMHRRFPGARAIVVVEAEAGMFRAALAANDLRPVLGSERVHWLVGAGEAEIRRALAPILDGRTVRAVDFVQHPGSVRRAPEAYQAAVTAVRDVLLQRVADLVTGLQLVGDWLRNKLFNMPHVVANPGVKHLFDRFAGKPAIIVSAGPSLDKNVRLLAEARGRAVILCVDTAIKALLRHGIHPDFVLSVDGSLLNYRHFEGVEVDDVWLVAEPMTHHRILDEWRGPKLIASFGTPAMRWLESFAGEKGRLITGGSVATFAFSLAVRMGADPIVFVGQDLSYPDGRFYASGTYYAENGYRFDQAVLLRVPANDGGEVLTPRNMYTFLKWFESAIPNFPDRTVINATEGGARIEGTRVMTLREVIDRYCREPVPVAEVLTGVPAPQPRWERFLRELEGLERRLKRFAQLGRRGERLARRLERLVSRDYVGTVPQRVQRLLADLDAIDRRFQNERNRTSFDILTEILQPVLFALQRAIRQEEQAAGRPDGPALPEDPEKRREIARRSIALYAGITTAAEHVQEVLREAVDRVRQAAGLEVTGCGRSA